MVVHIKYALALWAVRVCVCVGGVSAPFGRTPFRRHINSENFANIPFRMACNIDNMAIIITAITHAHAEHDCDCEHDDCVGVCVYVCEYICVSC